MPKKIEDKNLVRDWKVLVRFRPANKAVILAAMENWTPAPGEEKTMSSFVRHCVWMYSRPPGAKTTG